jgi:hypothetical protein
MEVQHRVELINTLLVEADQKMNILHHALAAKDRSQDESQHRDDETLKDEHALWERARTGLIELRTVLEKIEKSERLRGVS